PYTIHDEVRDVAAVMDATGLESAHIYGRSRGGMLAQEFALSQPARLRSLILSGTTDHGPESTGSTERVERAMHFTAEMSREEIFAAQDEAMASPGWRERDPAAFAYCLAADLEAPPRRFAVQCQQAAFADWTSHGRLASITAPTLVLCGEDDGMVPPENSRRLARTIPGARLELIPQCGHLPMLEQPEAVAQAVFGFLGVQ
ncbi:MAG: alpha/beta fold hydrolase, partial [Tepidiformaceae bacterium]